jgi:hypothetical protein
MSGPGEVSARPVPPDQSAAPLVMSRADRQQWQAARSLGDVASLTALALEGAIGSRPGYMPGHSPEPERLVPVLAALCRAGCLTYASQRVEGPGERAAVAVLCPVELADQLKQASRAAGLVVITNPAATLPNCHTSCGRRVTVTRTRQEEIEFGERLYRTEITSRRTGWGMLHGEAVDALCDAWQVTLADPQWGRPDVLWRALADLALTPGGAR